MSIIDNLGKVIKVLQKAGQIDVINTLIEAQQYILELQSQFFSIQKQNEELKNIKELENDVVKHKEGYITLKSEESQGLQYCGICWAKYRQLIPLIGKSKSFGVFFPTCQICKAEFDF